jgi:hypothetical protein
MSTGNGHLSFDTLSISSKSETTTNDALTGDFQDYVFHLIPAAHMIGLSLF